MKIYLRDRNPEITKAWAAFFGEIPEVEISTGNIFEGDIFARPTGGKKKADAIVSPANSFGFMDGGIDAVYTAKFGYQLEDRLRHLIADKYYGELPVGQAVIIETNHPHIPWLVSAPTMRVPTSVAGTANAYLAFRAALIAVQEHNEAFHLMRAGMEEDGPGAIESLICPGLGTAVGQMSPFCCAKQMWEAYKAIILRKPIRPSDVGDIYYAHQEMVAWDKYGKTTAGTVDPTIQLEE